MGKNKNNPSSQSDFRSVHQLTRRELIQLKEAMICQRNEEREEGTSDEELILADELISDEEVFEEYSNTIFVDEDFF